MIAKILITKVRGLDYYKTTFSSWKVGSEMAIDPE